MLLGLIIFGTLATACFGTLGYLYYEYARSPQKAWRDRVWTQFKRASATCQTEQTRLRRLANEQASEEQAAHEQALASVLRALSVDELAAYPGIGPGTVGKLRAYGVTDLAKLRDLRTHIPGLGDKRLTDIHTAARDLVQKSSKHFENGTGQEGDRFRAALAAVRAKFEASKAEATARAEAAHSVVEEMQPLVEWAGKVSFPRYHIVGSALLVPAEAMAKPLPDLDGALRQMRRPALAPAVPVEAATPAQPVHQPPSPPQSARRTRRREPTEPAPDEPMEANNRPARAPAAVWAKLVMPPREPARITDPVLVAMDLTIAFAFAIARADGAVSPAQRAAIDAHIDGLYGHEPAHLNRARAFCAHYVNAAIDVGQCLARMEQLLDPAQKTAAIQFSAELAAGGHPKAKTLLERAARQLGVALLTPSTAADSPAAPTPAARDDYLAALEISASTPLSAELIRRQYHLLSDRYSPEKVQHMGAEFVALAETKRTGARSAALALLEPLGEPLEPAAPPPQELRHNPDLDDVFGA